MATIPKDNEVLINENFFSKLKFDNFSKIEFLEDSFAQISEYEIHELIMEDFDILRHPETPNIIYNMVWNDLLQKKDSLLIAKFSSKYGNYFWLTIKFTINSDNDNNVSYHLNCSSVSNLNKKKLTTLYNSIKKIELHATQKVAKNYFNGKMEEAGKENYLDYFTTYL